MRVLSSSVELSANSYHRVEERTEERRSLWAPAPPRARPDEGPSRGAGTSFAAAWSEALRALERAVDRVSLPSSDALDAPAAGGARPPPRGSEGPVEAASAVEDARRLLVRVLLVGERLRVAAAAAAAASAASPASAPSARASLPRPGVADPAPTGVSGTIERVERRVETEGYAFAARGGVVLADGRSLDIELALAQERRRETTTASRVQVGQRLEDPLVVNLDGGPASLTSERVRFDLDADGQAESVANLGAGKAFLALDRDGSGAIEDGRELFGPSSGNGFGELAALDADGSGWIDEADPEYARLRLYRMDDGASRSLAEAGIGALSVQSAATRYDLDGGRLAHTGLALAERGGATTVQHVDLAV